MQPNEVTQAAQHALSPLQPDPLSSPDPLAAQAQAQRPSQPPPQASMSPPVASLFDQVTQAATQHPAPPTSSAHQSAVPGTSAQGSAESSKCEEDASMPNLWPSFAQDSSSSSRSRDSSEAVSQACDRPSTGDAELFRDGEQLQPQSSSSSTSSSSPSMPLPGEHHLQQRCPAWLCWMPSGVLLLPCSRASRKR